MITVNGTESQWEENLTVSALLARERFTFKMLAVWINDSVVDKSDYDTKLVPDGAVVQVIHNISGG